MFIAMFIYVVRNRNNLNRFLLCCCNIKRFCIIFCRLWCHLMVMIVIRRCGSLAWIASWEIVIRRIFDIVTGLGRAWDKMMLWRMMTKSVIGVIKRVLLFYDFNDWHWIWNGHWLLHCNSFRYFYDLRWYVLLPNHVTKINELLASLFQVSVISIHSKIEMWLRSIVMNAINLMLNVIVLLLIEEVNLSLKLFSLLIKLF